MFLERQEYNRRRDEIDEELNNLFREYEEGCAFRRDIVNDEEDFEETDRETLRLYNEIEERWKENGDLYANEYIFEEQRELLKKSMYERNDFLHSGIRKLDNHLRRLEDRKEGLLMEKRNLEEQEN